MNPSVVDSPSIVQTEKGASVFYKGRYLYSRYQPKTAITRHIEKLDIPPAALVIVGSPLLGYGLDVLLERLPASAAVLAVEYDPSLMMISRSSMPAHLLHHPRIQYISTQTVSAAVQAIDTLPHAPFKRVLYIAGSGGAGLYTDFYRRLVQAADEYIRLFWRNRMTLIHLGRNYARNLFANLIYAQPRTNICTHIPQSAIKKPIVVVGAGPSLDMSRQWLIKNRSKIWILSVDAALPALMPQIRPDGVVLVESQPWIDRAFIGFSGSDIPLFADCTASPRAVRAMGGRVFLFFSNYTTAAFLTRIQKANLFDPILPPLGTVGLTALSLALHLADNHFPVIHTGLDFSWKRGFTHAKGTSQLRALRSRTKKISPLYSASGAFSDRSFTAPGKNGEVITTLPNLHSYAELYTAFFSKNPRIHDLDIPLTPLPNIHTDTPNAAQTFNLSMHLNNKQALTNKHHLHAFLASEYKMLTRLKSLLTGKTPDTQNAVLPLLTACDYLYIHFPDAYRCSLHNQDFLNRVRIELEYFLKTIKKIKEGVYPPASKSCTTVE